ncbi:hypothetical protein [Paraburkholderia sp. GAS348]|uniref:hypothetical protein n=1 Tax=Paraburkholderia sp. GAS348 TaxID=3035132 RepID=UPI003D261343
MNMNSKRISVLSATAMALLALSGAAKAADKCSLATLNGAYGFSAQGKLIGLLDSTGGVHPFVTQQLLNDVALVIFNGSGHFKRIDTGTVGGAPKGGQTDFTGNQSGYYTVNSNCTGTMTIQYDSGVTLLLEMVVTDDARLIKAIIITETLPGAAPTIDNTPCQAPCAEAVEVSLEGRKVEAFGFR